MHVLLLLALEIHGPEIGLTARIYHILQCHSLLVRIVGCPEEQKAENDEQATDNPYQNQHHGAVTIRFASLSFLLNRRLEGREALLAQYATLAIVLNL